MDGYTYETVYKIETGSYEWAVIAVFKRSDGAFAVVSEAGCSCNYFEDDCAQRGAEYGRIRARVYEAFRKALIAHQYSFNIAQAFEAEDAMRQAVNKAWPQKAR
jgi:hypothetical protein